LPKTLTPHFCKRLFGQNGKDEDPVTITRAETYTDSIEEFTQLSPKTLASFPLFYTKLIFKLSTQIIHNKSYDECYRNWCWISGERPLMASK
jgi:hypothetical protein